MSSPSAHPLLRRALAALATGLLLSCAGDFEVCEPVAAASLAAMPQRLSDTGLFADGSMTVLAEGVKPFTPWFPLWTDGATKRRWIRLPPGARIDTSDMDDWQFPQGTRLWKEFTRDGVRVETRLLEKAGPRPEDWRAVAYVWLQDQSDAVATPAGQRDANGTPHDVPASADCFGCHGGTRSRVLGFSAIQLSQASPPDHLDLEDLIASGALTQPPSAPFTVPGNDVERASLGYLHANCGHCHNLRRPESEGARCYAPLNDLDFRLQVGRLGSPGETPTYRTGNSAAFNPRKPDSSRMIKRISQREPGWSMPLLGTELVDKDAVTLLRRWISEMEDD
ncbi:hypothetical protein [Corallococcus sicarius]|uniref:Cytochrome c domain-containing protein n=1 Tax=Corallococcus sicarius TaxID=2316726 RepID=A0A3A8N5F0_9BACT|nr:hypothetical protein [Corallococcus sicarius]RKH39476.1 hypothetical protein D7X12_23470 [Corallococcus sicarius]